MPFQREAWHGAVCMRLSRVISVRRWDEGRNRERSGVTDGKIALWIHNWMRLSTEPSRRIGHVLKLMRGNHVAMNKKQLARDLERTSGPEGPREDRPSPLARPNGPTVVEKESHKLADLPPRPWQPLWLFLMVLLSWPNASTIQGEQRPYLAPIYDIFCPAQHSLFFLLGALIERVGCSASCLPDLPCVGLECSPSAETTDERKPDQR